MMTHDLFLETSDVLESDENQNFEVDDDNSIDFVCDSDGLRFITWFYCAANDSVFTSRLTWYARARLMDLKMANQK